MLSCAIPFLDGGGKNCAAPFSPQAFFFVVCFAAADFFFGVLFGTGAFFIGFFRVDFVLDAHIDYIDAYTVNKKGLRRPSGGPHHGLRLVVCYAPIYALNASNNPFGLCLFGRLLVGTTQVAD